MESSRRLAKAAGKSVTKDMASWVRYSVAVYMGLLISGALARPQWQPPSPDPAIAPSVYNDATPPASEPTTNTRADASA